jgi:hypothetical protein
MSKEVKTKPQPVRVTTKALRALLREKYLRLARGQAASDCSLQALASQAILQCYGRRRRDG